MPNTPHGLPYPLETAFVKDGAAAIQALAVAVDPAIVNVTTLAAAPPAAPLDGELWTMAPAAGVVWTFRFNAGSPSPYKWEFAGGPELAATPTTVAENTGSPYPAFVDLPSGPSLVVARAGDYVARFSGHGCSNTAATGVMMGLRAAGAAVGASDFVFATTNVAGAQDCLAHQARLNDVPAGAAIAAAYAMLGGGVGTFERRQLLVHPVRVA